jgi:hypothetical protein
MEWSGGIALRIRSLRTTVDGCECSDLHRLRETIPCTTEYEADATREIISKMDLRETGCKDGRWMELAQDRVQWRALVSVVLNLRALLLD